MFVFFSLYNCISGLYGQVVINENGDRDSEYTLWDMTDTENGTFEVRNNTMFFFLN